MIDSGTTDCGSIEVLDVPGVRVAPPHAGEVRPRPLGAPLEGMVVHRLGGEAVVPVALHLVAHRADHLAVADVAALADVDVAPRQLQRRVGPHALHLLDGVLEVEEGHDLHDAADEDHEEARAEEQRRVALQGLVMVEEGHCLILIRPGWRTAATRHLGAEDGHPQVPGHDRWRPTGRAPRPGRGPRTSGTWRRRCRRRLFTRKPLASTSRHIRPSMMPVTHIEAA